MLRGKDATNKLTEAGTYTVTLTPKKSDSSVYSDSYSFTFTVNKIDLANSKVTVDPVENDGKFDNSGDKGTFQQGSDTHVYVQRRRSRPERPRNYCYLC